jgi:cellulose synthase/poly-beta-1,6-N-acetylglucosamine synthase-like glycosyltransferase
MESMIVVVLLCLAMPYLIMVAALAIRLKEYRKPNLTIPHVYPEVSIIIASRNESANIPRLMKSLARQSYPHNKYEIILADDHSTDNTIHLAHEMAQEMALPLKIISLGDEMTAYGKRAAISLGVGSAKYDTFLFTDADVSLSPNWIISMVEALNPKCELVAGPVILRSNKGYFSKLEAAEYLSVSAMTAACGLAGHPIMANGANLLVTKKAYLNALSNRYQKEFQSGDDMFLLEFIRREYGDTSMVFCGSKEALVEGDVTESLASFIAQRIRWAGKATGYRDRSILLVGFFTFLFNVVIAITPLCFLVNIYFLMVYGILLLLRAGVEGLLLWRWSGIIGHQGLFKFYFVLLPFYPYYVLVIGLLSLFVKPMWKGRRLS